MRKGKKIIEKTAGGCYLNIEVSPRAKRSEILGVDIWRGTVKFNIAEVPDSGKANRELIQLIESIFPEVKGKVKIVRGRISRLKSIFIPLQEEIIRNGLGIEGDQ